MRKCLAIAAIALSIGLVASPPLLSYISRSMQNESVVKLMEAWSSEGKPWADFSRFIEAGGRAYWTGEIVFNGLQNGMDEEDIRKSLGPPDAVLLGEAEVWNSFRRVGQVAVDLPDRRRPLDYIPYLHKDTAGLYVFKMGRIASSLSVIEQSVMCLEFSAQGKLTSASIVPVSPSNPIGDFMRDTRTDKRVRPSH
jgi:hypothetical protein